MVPQWSPFQLRVVGDPCHQSMVPCAFLTRTPCHLARCGAILRYVWLSAGIQVADSLARGAGWLLGSNQKGWKGGSERTRKRNWLHLGTGLHKTRLFASFWAGFNEMKRNCWRHLRDWLREIGLLASFGGSIMRNKVVCFIWDLYFTKQGCWRRLGAQLLKWRC